VQQPDEIWEPSRESKLSVNGLFSLIPGFSRMLKASNAEAVSTAFLQGKTVETVCRFDRCIHQASRKLVSFPYSVTF
jgi:putative ribosome biogenesis GTPase RsgA